MDKDGQTVERGDTLGDIADGNEGVEGDCTKRPSRKTEKKKRAVLRLFTLDWMLGVPKGSG